jgi:hypothetical protein
MAPGLGDLEPVAAPYVAFRHWNVDGDRLFSVGRHPLSDVSCPSGSAWRGRIEWPVDRLTALPCSAGPAPTLGCSCGVYATRALKDPGRAWRNCPRYERHVIGAVALWGRVVEHEWGYRAQHARPVALLEGYGAERIAETYGVPVLSADEIVRLAS